jgi:anti-sigma B factor antagonist
MASMILHITSATAPDGTVTLTCAGEIDITSAPDFRRALDGVPAGDHLVIDLTGVRFLDSAGVKVLYDHLGRQPEIVLGPDSAIQRVLSLTGLRDLLTVRQQ